MIDEVLGRLGRREHGRILASLIRVLGDFDVSEDALSEAYAAALAQWPKDGVPDNPVAWLVSTARHKAVDAIRRRALGGRKHAELLELGNDPPDEAAPSDTLRLVFTCCHPALALESRVALTLRTVCGLPTEAIARAFLVPETTLQQRLVRAKNGKRIAAFEVLVNTPYIADLILNRRTDEIKDAMAQSSDKGMLTFDASLYQLYKSGRIEMEEALTNSDSRSNMEAKINFGV